MKKKINLAFLLVLVLHFSCASLNYWKVKVELPEVASLNLDQFKELVVSNFLVEKETKDFNLNQELVDFFSEELVQHFKGKIRRQEISWGEKDIFQKEDFWKTLLPGSEETLILTGSVNYSEEIRKAILEDYSRESEEYFPSEKGLAQRKFYTLNLSLYLIEAKTGEILYTREFKESRGYKNPKQTANFAFFDLMEKVRAKFFSNILGEERVEQRYLISD
jgi:hypothetical protein